MENSSYPRIFIIGILQRLTHCTSTSAILFRTCLFWYSKHLFTFMNANYVTPCIWTYESVPGVSRCTYLYGKRTKILKTLIYFFLNQKCFRSIPLFKGNTIWLLIKFFCIINIYSKNIMDLYLFSLYICITIMKL